MRYRNEVMGDHSGSVCAEGWSYGIAEHLTKHGFFYCVDAHRDGKRFIVKADDLLTACLSLERDAIALKANGKSNQEYALQNAYLPAKLANWKAKCRS